MNYTQFIKLLAEECGDNGIGITQPKLKKLFEIMADLIVEVLEEDENVKLREFITFEVVKVHPKILPNGNMSDEQYSVKIRLSNKYKERLKKKLNE